MAPRGAARPRGLLGLGCAPSRCSAALREPLAGYRPPLVPDPWEMLVTSITAQQVSLHSAFAVRSRLIERFGVRHREAWAFPSRERIAEATESEIREVGFSTRKAEYVTGLARGDLDLEALEQLPDDEVVEAITAQRGLGRWTADWFLARALGRPDCLAGRRPRRAQGGVVLLRFRQRSRRDGGTRGGRAVRVRGATSLVTCCSRARGCTDDGAQRHPRRPRRARGALAGVRGRGAASGARGGRRRDRSWPRSARSSSRGSAGWPRRTAPPSAWRSPGVAGRAWVASPTSTSRPPRAARASPRR